MAKFDDQIPRDNDPRAMMDALIASRVALNRAWSDIGEWLQLAHRQREVLEHGHAACPNATGIKASEKVQAEIGQALTLIRNALGQF